MLEFAQTLYEELLRELDTQDSTPDLKPFSPDQRLGLITTCIDRVKEKLKSSSFGSESEEIRFFKHFLPQLLSLFIYYTEKFEYEAMGMLATQKSKLEYFERQSTRIDLFFKENAEFLKYYWAGKADLDKAYFLRGSLANGENRDLITTIIDPLFYTAHTIKAANLLAYSKLEKEIHRILTGKPVELPQTSVRENKLEWTDAKTGLIELIYSLKEQGAFNNGQAGLKNIIHYFEQVFSVNLGNTSSGFQKIMLRKKGYTHYIDQLKGKLDYRIDQMAEGNS